MRKAGGLIALISGFFCVLATIFVSTFSVVAPAFESDLDPNDAITYGVGGFFVSGVVIILSAILLNTRSRVPAVILIVFSIFAITFNIGSGFVALCLVFAIIGGIFALFK